MKDFSNKCFVCGKEVDAKATFKNATLNLPVCEDCRGTENEKKVVDEYTEGLADGFVCGCI